MAKGETEQGWGEGGTVWERAEYRCTDRGVQNEEVTGTGEDGSGLRRGGFRGSGSHQIQTSDPVLRHKSTQIYNSDFDGEVQVDLSVSCRISPGGGKMFPYHEETSTTAPHQGCSCSHVGITASARGKVSTGL